MLSLIGRLTFASKVIPAGCFFLRHLIDIVHSVQNLNHHIDLNKGARTDLAWWEEFLPTWNGKSTFLESNRSIPEVTYLYTDAAGSIGFGAYCDGRWFNGPWPVKLQSFSIVWNELFLIFLACLVWGYLWKKTRICFHCDNQAVVDIWIIGSLKDPAVMALVRKTFLTVARNNFTINIDGTDAGSNSGIKGRDITTIVPADHLMTQLQYFQYHAILSDRDKAVQGFLCTEPVCVAAHIRTHTPPLLCRSRNTVFVTEHYQTVHVRGSILAH